MNTNNMFPGATIFQYDYLNDDVGLVMSGSDLLDDKLGWKLPRSLREALADKSNKWVVLMNPPYGTSQGGLNKGSDKEGVAETKIRKHMLSGDYGLSIRELFSQFIYRIVHEIPKSHLCMYTKTKYINAPADESFRNALFSFKYEDGFMFPSATFSGTKGDFPIGFCIWNLSVRKDLLEQKMLLDVYGETPDKIGKKEITVIRKEQLLNAWVSGLTRETDVPPLKSALSLSTGRIFTDKLPKDGLGEVCSAGNDIMHQKNVCILSSAYGSAGSFPIAPSNFDRVMVLSSVKLLVQASWLNDRDQFRQPTKELPEDLVADCAVWSLFHGSNCTSSLKDVEYKGKTYQVRNQFFPYLLSELREWDTPHDLSGQIRTAQDTFVANWLKGRAMSAEAQAVLDAGRKVYQVFYKEYKNLNLRKFKIDYWDVGFYQIRNALLEAKLGLVELNALKEAHTKLALKLRPKVYEYGFLDQEILYV
jgi:hypothetical protein